MYGKLIDGKLIKAKHFIQTDKETIINPTREMYEKYGYKKVIENEIPNISENQTIEMRYEEKGNKIVKIYEIKEIEQE